MAGKVRRDLSDARYLLERIVPVYRKRGPPRTLPRQSSALAGSADFARVFHMNETSLSLLNRLRRSPDSESWNRLVDLYGPLIKAWLRKYDVQDNDADDVVQEVLLAVSKDLGKFDHRGQTGAFRGWIKAILVNRLRKFWRARDRRPQARGDSDVHARLAQLEDPGQRDESDLESTTRPVRASTTADPGRALFRAHYLESVLSCGAGWREAGHGRQGIGDFLKRGVSC